jgi:hypothetical protein
MGLIFDWTLGTIPCASNDKSKEIVKNLEITIMKNLNFCSFCCCGGKFFEQLI